MTSLQRDPRKQYVLDKRNCKDLSITQKLYHPECRKEATVERPINPKPKPKPQPQPKPQPKPKPRPNVPDLPPEPGIPYSFKVSDYPFNYRQGQSYNPLITGMTTGALAGVMVGEAVRYARASPPDGYSRVATEDPDRPSARRLTEGDVDRPRFTAGQRGSYYGRRLGNIARITPRDLPADEGFNVEEEDRFERPPPRYTIPRPNTRARVSDIQSERQLGRYRSVSTEEGVRSTSLDFAPSSAGLRFRGRGMTTADDITFTNIEEGTELPEMSNVPLQTSQLPTTRAPIQSRIPFWSQLPRAKPPTAPPPSSSTAFTDDPVISQGEIELRESKAKATTLSNDLDNMLTQQKADQSAVTQAEAKLTQAESMETAGTEIQTDTSDLATIRTADIQAQAEADIIQAEGATDSASPATESADITPDEGADTAVAEGAEAGAESALKDPKSYTRPIALLGGLAVGAGVGAGVSAISQALVNSADSGTNENIAEQAQRQANNNQISSIITGQITNPMEYSPYAVVANIVGGIFAGSQKASTFGGIPNTGIMTSDDIKNTLTQVNNELSKATAGSSQYNSLSALSSALTNASKKPNGGIGNVIAYTNAQGQSELGFPLTKPQLATAIKVYQQNPNAFKGVDPTKLQIMGLSPEMTKGIAGATQTSIGYIPTIRIDGATWTSGAGGGNWTDFYTSVIGKGAFNSNSDVDTSAVPDTQQETILNDNYISQVDTIIDAQTNPQVKAYLQYELDTFKYKIGYLPTPPTPVPKPVADPAMSAELTELQNNLAREKGNLQATQESIQTQTSLVNTANTKISSLTTQLTTEQQQAQAQQMASYRTQVSAYNQQVAQNIDKAEGETASYNIAYARATNTPLLAPTGQYITPSQRQAFQAQLASGQIKTTGVTPITTLAPTGITTSASGSPVVNQNALKTTSTPTPVPVS